MSWLRHFPPTGYINLKFLTSSLWKLTWFLMFRFPKVVLLGIFPPAVAFATLAVWLTTLLIIAATPPMGWTCNSSVEALRRDPGSEIPSTAISQWAKNEIENSENSTKESSGTTLKIINRSAEIFLFLNFELTVNVLSGIDFSWFERTFLRMTFGGRSGLGRGLWCHRGSVRTKTTCLMTPSTGMTTKNWSGRRFGLYWAGINANFVGIVSVTFCSIIWDGSIKTESEMMVLQILQYFKALYIYFNSTFPGLSYYDGN